MASRQDYRVYEMADGRVLCARCKIAEYPRKFPGEWKHFREHDGEKTPRGGVICHGCGHEVYAPSAPGRPPSGDPPLKEVMLRLPPELFERFEFQMLLARYDSFGAFARRLLTDAIDERECTSRFDAALLERLRKNV